MSDREPTERPSCLRCVHFYVDWQPPSRRGCRAYAFLSEDYPSQVVLDSSGEPCKLFERKQAGHEPAPSKRGGRFP